MLGDSSEVPSRRLGKVKAKKDRTTSDVAFPGRFWVESLFLEFLALVCVTAKVEHVVWST